MRLNEHFFINPTARLFLHDKRSIDGDRLNPHYPGHTRITKRDVYRIAVVGRLIIAHPAMPFVRASSPCGIKKQIKY